MKYKYLEAVAASHLTYYSNGNPSAGTFPKHFFWIWMFFCFFINKSSPHSLRHRGTQEISAPRDKSSAWCSLSPPCLHPNIVLPREILSLSCSLEASFLWIPQLCQLQMPAWLFSLCCLALFADLCSQMLQKKVTDFGPHPWKEGMTKRTSPQSRLWTSLASGSEHRPGISGWADFPRVISWVFFLPFLPEKNANHGHLQADPKPTLLLRNHPGS